jgi:hypothetical protein
MTHEHHNDSYACYYWCTDNLCTGTSLNADASTNKSADASTDKNTHTNSGKSTDACNSESASIRAKACTSDTNTKGNAVKSVNSGSIHDKDRSWSIIAQHPS